MASADNSTKILTGIFGGSFNPIHNGHIRLAHRLLCMTALDEIWFMVSPQNPLKQESGLLCDRKRMQLVKKALENEQHFVACDYELNMPKPSYTYLTMRAMSSDFPDRRFVLIIGADNWQRFNLWRNSEELLNLYPIFIYPRTGSPVDTTTLPPSVQLIETGKFDISSTEIRKRIANGDSIEGLVPDSVAKVIEEEKLFTVSLPNSYL